MCKHLKPESLHPLCDWGVEVDGARLKFRWFSGLLCFDFLRPSWSFLHVCSLQECQERMLFWSLYGSLTSRSSLLNFWLVYCSAACPNGTATSVQQSCGPCPGASSLIGHFYCQLLETGPSPSTPNQISSLLKWKFSFLCGQPCSRRNVAVGGDRSSLWKNFVHSHFS